MRAPRGLAEMWDWDCEMVYGAPNLLSHCVYLSYSSIRWEERLPTIIR